MSKISNLEHCALNVSGDNYLQWALDTKIMLKSKGLGETITEDNTCGDKERYRAIYMIRHHLVESLKDQYLTIEDPLALWYELKQRYDHQRMVLLPKARYDWGNLRIQDFQSVDEYNSAMFKIVSRLKLCGEDISEEDMLEKTYSTFHSSNVVLQQQYREKGFKTYSSLIACLLLAETNNELLLRNSELRPPGSAPLPDPSHSASKAKSESHHVHHNDQSGNSRGKDHRRGRGKRTHGQGRNRGRGNAPGFSRGHGRGRGISFKPQRKSVCHRCGMDDHWAKTCRTAEHLVKLYKASQEKKNPEANMVYQDNENDMVTTKVSDPESHDKEDYMEYETSDILK